MIEFKYIEENNTIEVIFRESSASRYASGQPIPDKVRKEIYGVVDGKIKLVDKVQGKHIPGYFTDEKIIFE